MADRNEDFNWYPGPELSLFLSLSAQRRLALFSSFFFFFVIVSFRLSFPYHSLALSLVPFSTKTTYRDIPATVICIPANVRGNYLRAPLIYVNSYVIAK